MPDFDVLDAKIASALNSIIHNTQIKKERSVQKGQQAPKKERFLRGKQIENYAALFTIVLRNDDIQEFDSEWDGILLSMTKSHLMTSW